MLSTRLLTPLAFAVMVSGCALHPSPAPAPLQLPEQYVQAQEQADEAERAMSDWWDRYHDAELSRIIDLAQENNQDIAVSHAQFAKAMAVLGQTMSAESPTLSGSGTGSKTSANTANVRDHVSSHQVAGLASYEFDMWGRLSNATNSSVSSAESAMKNILYVQKLIRNQVLTQYWTIRQMDAELSVLNEQIDSRRKQLSISESRLTYGVTSELDVEQSKADLASLERTRITTRTNRDVYVQSLAILAGKPDLKVAKSSNIPDLIAAPKLGLPSALLQRRPDLVMAEKKLEAAGFDVAVARAALFPSISLTAQGGGRSGALSSLFGSGSSFWTLGYTLDLPIFDGGLRLSQIDQAEASQQELAAEYQKAMLTAFSDVNKALINLDGYQQQTPWMKDELAAAQKAMDFALRKYQVGTIDYSTLLDTQRSLLDAKKADVGLRYGKLISQANLYYALGN
ncbi:efflux transporter outer membrane subunit [Pseudomonas amygdali]|uniref:Rnd efflux system n=1 Tax=Pseudomonas amygdali pv. lachrymans TaxID=53707 RepID=A0ABR5KQX0_PSEAV|nr:efflux transporter outer membrane subunit [Pseudomonas amygdali]KPC17132.1 Rnd efflux system [Pseudomonas amygdali pv. lachrymans]KPC18091.1 Rnd efflux system [Pseudomonas amygdali pv. lachrymans]RMT05987.1 Rnd efflux system, outer membrane lipoprotein [Pseudomonas amygdali pv. lachrymans]